MAATDVAGGPTIRVALRIWRTSESGERTLRGYEVDAPEWATLLDVLDQIKDQQDGTLAYRKSCRMMICGSCGMRMDGAAVLACKVRMAEIVDAGRVPVIAPMGNLPVLKDLVVDMNPFWEKYRSVMPYVVPAGAPEGGKEHLIPQQRMSAVHKESLCINCGCCVSECNAMESSPEFLGPQALAQAMRFVGDPRDARKLERLEAVNGEHGIWECTRCYFCNERCPKGVDPRDAIAKLGAESIAEGIDGDLGARHAQWFVTSARTTGWLRETELVPKTQGVVDAVAQARFALELRKHGKVPRPFPPHVAKRVREAGLLYQVVREQGLDGYRGIVQGERGLARLAQGVVDAVAQARFALELRKHGKVPRPFPPHVAKRVREAGLLYQVVREQGRDGYRGIVQGERGLARLAQGVHDGGRDPFGPGSFPRPFVAPDPEPDEGETENGGTEAPA